MLAETALRKLVAKRTAERGDDYFARGRVTELVQRPDDVIEATVQGSLTYQVELSAEDELLIVHCECPWFVGNRVECKHIWAAVRAATQRRLLPERPLVFWIDEEEDDDFDNIRAFVAPIRNKPAPKPVRPAWERFLQALPADVAATRRLPRDATRIPDEIAYLHRADANRMGSLTVQVIGRSRKRNGEWTKWKPVQLLAADIPRLDPFDRETVALLHSNPYLPEVEPFITVSQVATAWWVERLARAGKLLMPAGDTHRPIAWDDGPPWKLRVSIANDAAASKYHIDATVERDGETLPLAEISAVLGDILISHDRASRFDDGGRGAWVRALKASGPIDVPHADTESFRQALLRAPIAGVTLPEELGWELVEAEARPLLALRHDAWSAELIADLSFLYDEWRVSSRSGELQKTVGRKLYRRDRFAEDAFRNRLGALGAIATWDGFRIRLGQLEEVARRLSAEGWLIEIDAMPLRVTDDIDVEISSGIDWFDLNVSATFGDVRVALPELLAAADAKRSLLRLSDGSFGIVPTGWTESLTPVLDLGRRDGDAVRFGAAQALLIDALLQTKPHESDDAFAALRERLTSIVPEPRQEPATLLTELRPYQRAGLGWLHFLRGSGLGGCLADDMGLGKTVQTLALLEGLRVEGNTRPSLVVAPRSLLFNWAAEAARFAPRLRIREHHGADRTKTAESFADCDVVLTTYATMRLDIAHFAEIDFECVILDEAQAIKNATSQVAKASRLLRGRHRLALSGTPIENHLGELWSLFEFLNPGLLGSARAFGRTFTGKSTPPERREALARALRPLILRRTKEQVAPELPARTEQTLYCELEGQQRKQYDELRDHYRVALLGRIAKGGIEKARMQILEALLRLRQAACHPALIDPTFGGTSAKSELLMEELREILASGHRALVFSQFTSFLAIVRRALAEEKIPHLYLDGKTRDRQALVETFQGADGPQLFLISLKAGGLGLNLTNADYIFLLDPWWNPAVEAQAIDRAHRIGRLRPVVAYRLIARDTVEEKILELQSRKRDLADSIISEDNSVLRKLEVEDLEMLLG